MIGGTITDTLMNTLPKSLTIAILAVSIFISGSNVDFVGAQNTVVDPSAYLAPDIVVIHPFPGPGRTAYESRNRCTGAVGATAAEQGDRRQIVRFSGNHQRTPETHLPKAWGR